MHHGEVWAGLTQDSPMMSERPFETLEELLDERGWTVVGFANDVVLQHTAPPELSALEWNMPLQFSGIVDETLTSEVPVVYGTRIFVDPADFPGWDWLTFYFERDTGLETPIFRSRAPSEFPYSVDLTDGMRKRVFVSRDYPSRVRDPTNCPRDIVKGILKPMDLADHFSGRDIDYKRRHLRSAGWFALSDSVSLFAAAGEGEDARVEMLYRGKTVGELLQHTALRIQYLEHWFDVLQTAYPKGVFYDPSVPRAPDHSWPIFKSPASSRDTAPVGYACAPREREPRLALDRYERSLLAFHAARGELLDPLVLFDEDLDNIPDGSVVGYAGKEPKS